MKNTMKTLLVSVLAAMTFAVTSANAGVYEEVFARHYQHADGTALNAAEVADLAKIDSGSYGYTALAVVATQHAELGTIATALAQNESVHWATLTDKLTASQVRLGLGLLAADYVVKSQVFDNQARAKGYKLKDFTTDVINLSYTFGTDKAPK